QFQSEIPVAFALPPAFLVDFLLALFLAGLFPILVFRPCFAQHISEPAAYVPNALPRRVIMPLTQVAPCNPCQAFLDLVLVQPSRANSSRSRISANMALAWRTAWTRAPRWVSGSYWGLLPDGAKSYAKPIKRAFRGP
ncbi:MAG: hypothetical protein ACLGIP_18950, partial [Alphaproteobacteria bacterium]